LFALDDGRGDLAGVRADVLVRALDDREAILTLGTLGVRVSWSDAADVMIAVAKAFLKERSGQEWRITEVQDGEARILERIGLRATDQVPTATTTIHAGWYGDNALVATVPLGTLGQEQAAVIADVADEVRITPWRSVVLPGLDHDPSARLDEVGLVTKADSPWNGVTACAGQPGCAKALADVRADAWRVTPRLPRHGQPVHWSGCERRCGKPAGEFVDVLATGSGYVIDGERMGLR
jgi:precorrin-3B synthase